MLHLSEEAVETYSFPSRIKSDLEAWPTKYTAIYMSHLKAKIKRPVFQKNAEK